MQKTKTIMMKLTVIILILILISTNITIISASSSNEEDLPSYFSWRDIDGIDYVTPIKDQTPAPTCEAYALCAALETIMQYQEKEIFHPDLSETHLYFYAGGSYNAGYVNLVDAANYLVESGVPDEGCYPDPHRAYDYPFSSLERWEERTVKINKWGWVNNSVDDIKKALIEHGPLVFCAYLWKDFFTYRNGIYGKGFGRYAGGHVMAIVGYDDSEQCWIVKNSWGTTWGHDGWLKMAYDAEMITKDWYDDYDQRCTGIIYLDTAYGNFHPKEPKVYIQNMDIKKTYLFGNEFPIVLKNVPWFTQSTPHIIGGYEIRVLSDTASNVEFYIDGDLIYTDGSHPFKWYLDSDKGRHTLTVIGHNDYGASIDIRDFYMII